MNYKEIKSYEDACKALNIQPISENAVVAFPKADRKSMLAYHKLTVIARALNEGWQPDWSNKNEYKYYPIFRYINAGLSCANANGAAANTYADIGSRLCFKTEAISDYAAATFADLYKDFYCLPASADDEEKEGKPKAQLKLVTEGEPKGEFLRTSKDVAEKLQVLTQDYDERGFILIATDGKSNGEENGGAVIAIGGKTMPVIYGLTGFMTRPETTPLMKEATKFAMIKKTFEKVERDGGSYLADILFNNEPKSK